MCKKNYIFLIILLICSKPTKAIIYGSDSLVTRFTANLYFPYHQTDNEIRGFSYLESGFALENRRASCLYNAFMPVFSIIDMRNGTLTLQQDLILGDNAVMKTGGLVDANYHAMHFSTTGTVIIPLLSKSVTGNCLDLIDYDNTRPRGSNGVNAVSWSYDDKYICVGDSNGNVLIYSFDGTKLTYVNTASMGTNTNVLDLAWHPTADYIAAVSARSNSANEVRIFSFSRTTSAITPTSATTNPNQDVFSVSWRPDGIYILTYQKFSPPRAVIYSFTPPNTLTLIGSQNVTGSISGPWPRHVAEWAPTGGYFAAGTNNNVSGSELYVYSFNGATITGPLASGEVGRTVQSLDWSSTFSLIALGTLGSVNEQLEVWDFNSTASTLTRKVALAVGEADIYSVAWTYRDTYIIMGRSKAPATGNNEFESYYYDNSVPSLSLTCSRNPDVSVHDAHWSHDDIYVARGDDLGSSIGEVGVYYGNTIDWTPDVIFKNIKLSFDSDVRFNGMITFQGTSRFNGNNNILDFSSTGSLLIDSNATLILENLRIKLTKDGLIKLLGSTSKLGLRNVILALDDKLSFTIGSLNIVGDTVITGTQNFMYSSAQTSTIGSYATLFFDYGMTFSYASTAGRDLLAFADRTAVLHFLATAIYSISPGMQLKKGTVTVEATCPVFNNATTKDNGILFGDGVSAANDIDVKILPESGFDVRSGYLTSKLVSSS